MPETLHALAERKAHELEICSHALCSMAESIGEVNTAITLRQLLLQAAPEPKEVCICAALLMPNGYIIRGHRHDDCMATMGKCYSGVRATQQMQGFVTSLGRWVSREDAAELQNAAGIVSATTGRPVRRLLFSEDLY